MSIRRIRGAAAVGTLVLALALAVPGGRGGQGGGLLGYIPRDRVVELATAADGSLASFVPSPTALESFAALVDPVHLRMFLRASRPADLVLGAKIGRTVEAVANPALTLEFIAVTDDLSEPKALISESAVTVAPEIIVYWMGAEVGRTSPEGGSAVEEDLAGFIFQARVQIAEEMIFDREFFRYTFHKDLLPLDCKRCHGPAGRGLQGPD